MQLNHPVMLPFGLSPAEFEQLARDVFALVQRDRVYAEIDVAALTGKTFDPAETAQIRQLLGLYFAEVATQLVDEQEGANNLDPDEAVEFVHEYRRKRRIRLGLSA